MKRYLNGTLAGVLVASICCFGGPYIAYRVQMNHMEREHKQYVSDVGVNFEERLRELRIEAGLDPNKGRPDVIDMSHLFQAEREYDG